MNNEVGVTSDLASAVYVFPRTANGNVAPLRKLQGDRTQLLYPEGIFMDPVHNEIAVNNRGDKSILFFSRTANGNVPPLRVIKGPKTGIVQAYGSWVDPVTGEYWTLNGTPYFKNKANWTEYEKLNSSSILVFPKGANGDVAPVRKIQGDKTTLVRPFTLSVDTINHEIFLTSFSVEPGKGQFENPEGFVTVFDMRQSGNIAPKRSLRTNAFILPAGIFVSPEHEEIGILEAQDNMIMIFPRVW